MIVEESNSSVWGLSEVPAVTVCISLSLFIHSTVVPTFTVTGDGV